MKLTDAQLDQLEAGLRARFAQDAVTSAAAVRLVEEVREARRLRAWIASSFGEEAAARIAAGG